MSKRERAHRPAGPLGPWKLSLSVVVAAAFTGMPLTRAATSGVGLDMALARSFGAGFLTWVVVGSVNRIVANAEAAAIRDAVQVALEEDPSSITLG
ncbi:MAG: hypothetical protein AB7L17_21855 [Ilumatobacteraceae bacterium]